MADGGALTPSGGDPPRRRSTFTEELAAEIVEAVSLHPRSLNWLCAHFPHWPSVSTIWNWRQDHPEFRNAFVEARRRLADELAFETLEISDDSSGDARVIPRRDGSELVVLDQEFVARSKLRVESRRWLAAKLAPEVYGDRLDLTARVGPILSQEDALDQLR